MGSFEFPVDKYESQFLITRTLVALKHLPHESTEGPSLTLNRQVKRSPMRVSDQLKITIFSAGISEVLCLCK